MSETLVSEQNSLGLDNLAAMMVKNGDDAIVAVFDLVSSFAR